MSAIADKLKAMKDLLDKKIEGAPCFIASDLSHEYEILKNRPGVCKIAIGFESGKARSNFAGGDITGRENQYYFATISRGRGLTETRSDDLIYGSGGGSPLFELAEIMRDCLRTIRFDPVTNEQPDYIEMVPLDLTLYGMDGYRVKIWVGTQLPMLAPTKAGQQLI
jgi:hypothetical protein